MAIVIIISVVEIIIRLITIIEIVVITTVLVMVDNVRIITVDEIKILIDPIIHMLVDNRAMQLVPIGIHHYQPMPILKGIFTNQISMENFSVFPRELFGVHPTGINFELYNDIPVDSSHMDHPPIDTVDILFLNNPH